MHAYPEHPFEIANEVTGLRIGLEIVITAKEDLRRRSISKKNERRKRKHEHVWHLQWHQHHIDTRVFSLDIQKISISWQSPLDSSNLMIH